jgi:chorismate mutase/prephenate dehydratase
MTTNTYNLTEIRAQIDNIDTQIQELITERAYLAKNVALAKTAEEEQPNFYRPEREDEILRNVIARNQGPLSNETLTQIFQEIMSGCLALQKVLTIAFLGPAGTYSQTAVHKRFGHAAKNLPLPTIDEVFREVEANNANYGVVPMENSTEGGVNQTLDCLIKTTLKICGEIELPIHHHLLSTVNDLQEVNCIYAHQQALAQCHLWLNTHLPTIKRVAVNSNAEAARLATKETGAAAIAGETAAEIYQLHILAEHIADHPNNTTRFIVLGPQDVSPTGHDKTSLLLSSPDQPGALYHLLSPFADNQVNLTRIESRPARQGIWKWEYVFFVDLEGHRKDPPLEKALHELERYTRVKYLGSYPRATL